MLLSIINKKLFSKTVLIPQIQNMDARKGKPVKIIF